MATSHGVQMVKPKYEVRRNAATTCPQRKELPNFAIVVEKVRSRMDVGGWMLSKRTNSYLAILAESPAVLAFVFIHRLTRRAANGQRQQLLTRWLSWSVLHHTAPEHVFARKSA